MEMGSLNEKSNEMRGPLSVDPYQVDTGAQLVSGIDSALGQAESSRIRYVEYAERYLRLTISNKGGK